MEEKWYEPMRFEIEVIEVKSACRVNHKVGEKFHATYRTPDTPICGEAYVGMYPLIYAMRVDGDMRQLGKEKKFETTYYCPSRVVRFMIRGIPQCNRCGRAVADFSELHRHQGKYPMEVCVRCITELEG